MCVCVHVCCRYLVFFSLAVKSKVDGRDPMTIRAVFAAENFSQVVADTASWIDIAIAGAIKDSSTSNYMDTEASRVFAVRCTSGYHRADVVGRSVASVLNQVKDEQGRPAFNCMHIGACKEQSSDFGWLMQLASRWATHPWCQTIDEYCASNHLFLAAVQSRPESWAAWNELQESRSC